MSANSDKDFHLEQGGASDDSIVQYVYDERGHLLGEYDVNGLPLQETVYLGDIPIAVLKQTITTTTVGSVMVDNSDTANSHFSIFQ